MRVATLLGPRSIDVVDRPEPIVRPGSIVVEIDRCGIGGPDVEAYRTGQLPAPAWFGHEWVGRVVAIGPEVSGRFEGERVVGAVPPPCGRCRPCGAGISSACELVLSMIVGTDALASPHGAFAERIGVDARRVHRVPEGIDDANAAMAEPAAVAAHAVRRSNQTLGDGVVVIGAGTIGILVAELARLAGAAYVVAVDVQANRRELACALGADAAFAPGPEISRWFSEHGHGLGADVVYECSGGADATQTAINAVRQGGSITVVSLAAQTGSLAPAELVARELTVRASLGYTVVDVHRALELMADDRFRVSAIHDRTIGLGELASAFEGLASDPSSGQKILVSPQH